jgi:hypothetical protein
MGGLYQVFGLFPGLSPIYSKMSLFPIPVWLYSLEKKMKKKKKPLLLGELD